jgi:energy-coupling factor transporter ATP-binding protein EcfA2
MHIRTFRIHAIRTITDLDWRLSPSVEPAGWHVIIGDNGSGKSSILRSVALTLVGPSEAPALRQDWNDWLQKEARSGWIHLNIDEDKLYDHWEGKGRQLKKYYIGTSLSFSRATDGTVSLTKPKSRNPFRTLWSGKSGWFSAAYGPFRRFTGGDKDTEKMFYSHPRLARHLSVFGENVALSECLVWLQELKFDELEQRPEHSLLAAVTRFINDSGFLPHDCRIHDINSKEVVFVDPKGCKVDVEELSDGFRAILSMTFELIRQMTNEFEQHRVFDPADPTRIIVPGVVLIDEVDAHLHPTWQRRVGLWFRTHFPKMQFIVTTHSPLVCQAADVGSVFRLPTPGTNQKAEMVAGKELDRLLYGNVLDAYGTEMFGSNVARSERSLYMSSRLAELNQKEVYTGLTPEEREEQKKLRATLPSAGGSDVPA